MLSKTYVQACLDGDANIFDLDDYIDYWHDNDTGVTLREFLGLTPYEYQEWGKNSDAREILAGILKVEEKELISLSMKG